MQYANLKTNTRACTGKKSPAYKTVKYFVTMTAFLSAVCWMPITAPAQMTLPAGNDIPAFINSGNYDFTLAGNATWNSAFTINTAARAALRIEGANNTITVAAGGISMLRDFQTNNDIYINNANFRPTGTPGLSTLNDYLIGFERANIASHLNLEGSSFSGFSRTANRGGTIMYAYGSNNITIDGGVNGVLFQGNRAERDAAGVLAVTSSAITFEGKVTFDGNWTGNYGGAVTVYSDAANLLTFNGETLFTGNHAYVFGGAMDVWGGQATVVFNGPTTFAGNYISTAASAGTWEIPSHVTDQHPRGGAINIGYIASSGNGASVTFNGLATFTNNYVIANDTTKNAMGGAISVYGNGASYNYKLTFTNAAVFDGNYVYATGGNATASGGAIYYYSSAAVLNLASGTQFTNNYAKTYGGAIYLQAGTINLTAASANILFQGNRQGASFQTDATAGYVPVQNSGTPNAIYLNGSGTLNFNAAAGLQIEMYDPVASTSTSTVTVTKSGAGELIFYGDGNGAAAYNSDIRGNTTVSGGYFTLAEGVAYGNTSSGTFIVQNGGVLRGGNSNASGTAAAELRTSALTIRSGGALGATNGTFNINSISITLQDGALLTGNGTLTAASNLNISGTVTADIATGQTLDISPVVAGSGGLAKINGGALVLNTAATYTGATTINQGVLSLNTTNAITGSSAVTVNSGATLTLNNTAQSINNLSGGGTVELGTGTANTLIVNSGSGTTFSGDITGTGSLTKQGSGSLTLSGNSNYDGGTSINAGRLILTNGDAAGSGAIANNTTLELAFAADSTLANVISGGGALEKSGGGTAVLTATGSTAGSVTISSGTLNLTQTGAFTTTGNYTTQGNAVTAINGGSSLNVDGVFTQAANSTLNIAIVPDNITTPIITAGSASLSGTLDVTDLEFAQALKASELDDNRYLIIQTDAGIISGDFTTFVMGTVTNPQDYLVISGGKSADQKTYSIGLSLAWNAGAPEAHGTFTIAAGESFEVDVELNDQSPVAATGWDGVSLTKNGAGTLILSSPSGNGYTGATTINGGTLQTNIVNALLNSGSVVVNGGATLDLNNNAQIVQNLSGAGTVDLGTAALTVFSNADTTFDGLITGSGQLHKNGASTFTLTGVNDYSGGTIINDGRLVITNANAMGSGAIINDGTLELNFAQDGTLGNILSGSGTLIKSNAGAATLNSTNPTVGSVDVSGGSLVLADNVAFSSTGDYTTQSNAATVVNAGAALIVGGKLTQNANASLSVAVSDTTTPVTVNSATLDGKLVITNFPSLNRNARALETATYTVIQSTGGSTITGDFSEIDFGGVESNVDYLILKGVNNGDTYTVGFGLAWFAGQTQGHGTFTLDAGTEFIVDVDLANQAGPFASGWDGETLTKEGAGTLILDYQNTYTGATIINNGILRTNINDAFAQSSALKIAGGATLDLNGHAQTAADLSGAGMVNLSGSELTVTSNNDTVFSGNITGSGSFNKTGTATLTLTGNNTQDGMTQIAEGRLIATNAGALGTALINNSSELELAFANDGVITSQIQGSGHLIKSGGGNAVLNGPSFVQIEITASGGTLTLGEAINYYAGHSYTTQNGATTTLASGATLYGGQTFTQEAGAALNVTVGGDEPIITAQEAFIDGVLRVTGLDLTGRSANALGTISHVIIETQNGGSISGNFSELDLGGAQSAVDYLTLAGRKEANDTQYVVGLGLTWFAGPVTGHGTFTLAQAADSFNVDMPLTDQSPSQTGWDGQTLTKAGAGTLTLSAVNEYSGQTIVNGGTLQAGIIDTIALSSGLTVNSGATFDLNGFAQSIQSLSGSGTVALGASALTVNGNASSTFGGNLTGSGQLIKNGAGNLTLAGNNSPYTSNVTINSGGIVAANGNALGSGNVAINSPGTLTLNFSADGSLVNVFSGDGNLIKTGAYTTTLTGLNSQVGNVNVNQGGLTFGQTGAFSTSGNYTTAGGAVTTLNSGATLAVTGSFTQAANATLNVTVTGPGPIITAGNASINGALRVTGLDLNGRSANDLALISHIIIETTGGAISGNFTELDLGGAVSNADYLTLTGAKQANDTQYVVGMGLTWFAGSGLSHGTFTLNSGETFTVDTVLNNQTELGPGWDGQTLTKKGDGTLILSANNTYSGATIVDGGTLQMGVANAIRNSSELIVNTGSTFFLNDFDQTVNNLSGAGTVNVDPAILTVVNTKDTRFSGNITGDGSLVKDGAYKLTLSGESDYTGGTTINNGTLAIENGKALGAGGVTIDNGGTLELNFSADGTLDNTLSGGGALIKTGANNATLTATGSVVGSVNVEGGGLTFAQNGDFTVSGDYATAAKAATTLNSDATLAITGAFTQNADAALNVAMGGAEPMITAGTAQLDGQLNITGFISGSGKARDLTANLHVIIDASAGGTNTITGDFIVDFGGAASDVDYLILSGNKNADNNQYLVGLGLTWNAGPTQSHGTFTLADPGDVFEVDVVLANQASNSSGTWQGNALTKEGAGTLILSETNTYDGATTINGGTIQAGKVDTIAASSDLIINADGTFDLNNLNQTVNNLKGSGKVELGTADLTVVSNNDSTFSGGISGSGNLIKNGGGSLTLSGSNMYDGNTAINDGRLIVTGGAALGGGEVANNSELELSFNVDSTVSNQLTGSGELIKTGAGNATLTNANSGTGNVNVAEGTLTLAQNGVFTVNNNYTTADNATTDLSGGATLQVDGTFTQSNNAVLQVDLAGRTNTEAAISTGTAVIGGALVIDNFAPLGRSASDLLSTNYVIIDSTNLIQGDFTSVDFGGVASSVDYITLAGTNNGNTYTVGFGLTWNAAPEKSSGTFTLANPDDVFVVDVALDNKTTASGNPWDGRTLTKEGAGTLVLASATGNGYDGDTVINGGTLQMGVANAIENSGAVKVNANGTLDLNGFNQTVKNISGDGKLMLTNNAVLTVNNAADATLGGEISGTGSLVKNDGSTLTLSGDNSYSGGTTVNNGKLVATNGHAAGSGAITAAAAGALELNFAGDDTLANTLNNNGALTKTGNGNATLTGANSVTGSVDVSGGGLTLAQGDTFNVANDYTTANGASTGLDNNTTLTVGGTFTQAAGSTLNVEMGGTEPMITANQVYLGGMLNITGFTLGTRSASSATQNRHVIIRSNSAINGDFDSVDFGGAAVNVDYLRLSGQVEGNEYVVGLGLTWFAGTQYGNGVFTLTSATDSFDVDIPLTNQSASDTGWDGTTLTKNGAGTLILSAVNTYTGATLVNGGTLQMGVTDAIKTSSAVTLANGTTLDLNNFNQTVNNLSGAGNITLGSGTLTMINDGDDTLSGVISGTGGLVKQGAGNLSLSNASGTSVVGSVDVAGGGLTFTANTSFATTGNYTTAADASTTLGLGATLNVGGDFVQADDASLNIVLGGPGTTPVITADNATLGGALKITYATLARKASELPQVRNVLIQSNAPIINDFSSVDLGGVQSSVDYLTISGQIVNNTQYVIGLGLSWLAGPTLGHGTFTLADAADVFEVDIDLTDETVAAGNAWDGQTLTKRGDGTLIMSGVNSYNGKTLVEGGTLLVGITDGTDAVIAGTVTEVSAGATLAGKGTVSAPVNNSGFISAFNAVSGYENEAASNFTVGHLTNSGSILLAGGNVGNTLTVQGGLASQNGSLIINTVLGGDNSLTDKLVIDGGNVSGTTAVVVRNAGGGGLTDIGILVIDAQNGATTSATAFELSAASPGARAIGGTQTTITAGAYDYALVRGGVGGNEQSWYLVSAYGGSGGSARPEAGAYLANREAAESMFRLTMHDRMMSYNRLEQVDSGQKVSGVVWTRFNTGWRTTYADGRNLKTKIDTMVFQAGMDVWRYTDDNFGSLQTGVMLGIGHADGKTDARGGILNARSKTEGWSAGIYGTWFQNPYRRDGLYADAWLQHSWFDNTTNGRGLPKEDYKSRMWSASLETGYAMTLYKTPDLAISIDPFVQVIYSHYSADKIREAGGTIVKQKNSDLFTTRLGGRLHGDFFINEDLSLQPYLEISWWHNSQTGRISMDFDTVRSGMPKDIGEVKLGLNSKIGRSTTLSLGLFTQFGGNKYQEFGGQIGLRFDW